MWFIPYLVDVFVTPLTVFLGLLGNILSIFVLRKQEIQLRKSFARILIALAVFDITFIASSAGIFSLRFLNTYYEKFIYPYTIPVLLPIAQISLTASVYTTVVTCFDRYIAICRPALSGYCCGGSEDGTSWNLISGVSIFSVLYNLSRFFEYEVIHEETTIYHFDEETNTEITQNITVPIYQQTDLRNNLNYVTYYIFVSNLIFMGIFPMMIMITFNVLVVRAVNEANQRRARLTRRQQRNITVTSMLVSVVIFFLVCHSIKLIVNCYEFYLQITMTTSSQNSTGYVNCTNEFPVESPDSSEINSTSNEFNETSCHPGVEEEDGWPLWVECMTSMSHWLLILNSSCNIAIYLHKDPKFKAVLKDMMLTCFNIKHTPHADNDDLEESRSGAVRTQLVQQNQAAQPTKDQENLDELCTLKCHDKAETENGNEVRTTEMSELNQKSNVAVVMNGHHLTSGNGTDVVTTTMSTMLKDMPDEYL